MDDTPNQLGLSPKPANLPHYPPWQADLELIVGAPLDEELQWAQRDARSCLRRKVLYQENDVLARGLAGALEAALADVFVSDLPTMQTLTRRHLDEIARLQAQVLERMRQNLDAR